MKKFLFNAIAAAIIGAVCCGIALWAFRWTQKEALNIGLSVGLSGLIVEYLKPPLLKKKAGGLAGRAR